PHPLAHAPGIRTVSDRAAMAKVFVRSARPRKTREVMALDDALVAVTLGGRAHVNRVANLEHVADRDRLSELQLAVAAPSEFDGLDAGRDLALGKMTARRAADPAQLPLAEGDLDRFVTVSRLGLDLRHGAGPELHDGDRADVAGRVGNLGHTQFFSDKSVNHCITRAACSSPLFKFDLDVHARRQVELAQRVNRLLGRLEDIEQALMGADLKMLARLLVHVRRAVDAKTFDPGRQRNRSRHPAAGAPDSIDDLAHRLIEQPVIVRLKANAYLFVHRSLCPRPYLKACAFSGQFLRSVSKIIVAATSSR